METLNQASLSKLREEMSSVQIGSQTPEREEGYDVCGNYNPYKPKPRKSCNVGTRCIDTNMYVRFNDDGMSIKCYSFDYRRDEMHKTETILSRAALQNLKRVIRKYDQDMY